VNPGASEEPSSKRAWLAVLLSFLVPGLGHLYLREWLRGAFWFLTVLLAGNVLIPTSAVPTQGSFVDVITETYRAAPLEAKLVLVGLTVLCMVDAYWLASRDRSIRESASGVRSCPNCGKEVDEDLDFCHWCSADLSEAPAEGDETDLTAGELNERAGAFEGDLTGGPDDAEDEPEEK
jgi:hypothetical protein